MFAEGAQQLHLGVGVDLANLIQEQRATVRQFETSDAALLGTGEGSLFMAEQLAFKDLRRQRGAVHSDQFGLGASAQIVNGTCDQFLAGAAFAFNEDGRPGGRDLLDGLEDGFERVSLAEDALNAELLLDLLLQDLVFLLQAAAAQGAFHQQFDLVQVQRLGDKMVGAAPHGLDGGVHAAVGGHHDADGGTRHRQGLLKQFHAIVLAKAQIGEHDIDRVIAQVLQGLGGIGGHIAVELILQRQAQAVAGVLFVIDDQNGGWFGHRSQGCEQNANSAVCKV